MRRFLPYISALLLALWLPVTQHCALEAAGWLALTCPDTCEKADAATTGDGCELVESGAYKATPDTLKVSAPALFVAFTEMFVEPVSGDPVGAPALLPDEAIERPREWVPTWHFVRRAAPAPRAPAVILA